MVLRRLLGDRRHVVAAVATAAAAVALALVVSGRGCGGGDTTPDGAVRDFIRAARAGDERAAWELLGPSTRARLTRAAEGATAKAGGSKRFRALDMLEVGTGATSYAPSSVIVRHREAAVAVVDVLGPAGRRDEVTVVRVGTRWRVELP